MEVVSASLWPYRIWPFLALNIVEALTRDFGLNRSRYDPSFYYNHEEGETLVLVVPVDDYLYVRTTEISSRFESFLQAQFCISSTESRTFDITGAHLSQDGSGSIMLKAKDRLIEFQPIQ